MHADPMIPEYPPAELRRYRKKNVLMHYIKTLDIARSGTQINLSTLEGDVTVTAGPDTFVIIGPCNDVYPITRQRFESQYESFPEIDSSITEVLKQYGWDSAKVRQCRLTRPTHIYAKAMSTDFCVYVQEHDCHLRGKAGDYCAIPADDTGIPRPYIIQRDIMALTYEPTD